MVEFEIWQLWNYVTVKMVIPCGQSSGTKEMPSLHMKKNIIVQNINTIIVIVSQV